MEYVSERLKVGVERNNSGYFCQEPVLNSELSRNLGITKCRVVRIGRVDLVTTNYVRRRYLRWENEVCVILGGICAILD